LLGADHRQTAAQIIGRFGRDQDDAQIRIVGADLGAGQPAAFIEQLGIENDDVNGGTRLLSYKGGQVVFDQRNPRPPMPVAGSWANVDSRLGVVMVAGSGMSYQQAKNYTPGISVREDILFSSFSNQPRNYRAGDEVAHRITLFFVEVTPKETAALAESIKIENQQSHQVLRFKTPEGTEADIPLL